MPQYGFEALRGSGAILMGVTITHDPQLCQQQGINCNDPIKVIHTNPTNLATMSLIGDGWHYFNATYPGQPAIMTNDFTTGMNQARYVQFVFNGL